MSVTFNSDELLIIADSEDPLDVAVDLYSAWKEWVKLPGNGRFPPAFVAIGGNPLGGSLSAGSYFFLQEQYGWRFRPFESDHEWVIEGNLYPQTPGAEMFTPTLGGFTVPVVLERSQLTQTIGVGTTEEIANAVLGALLSNYTTPGTVGQTLALAAATINNPPIVVQHGWTNTLGGLTSTFALEQGSIALPAAPTATLNVELRDADGVLEFAQMGLTPNAEGYFKLDQVFVPVPGTTYMVKATVIDGTETWSSARVLAVPYRG